MTTVFQTIFAGVVVFVVGQIVVKIIIDPVQQLKKSLGNVAHALINYEQVYSNSNMSREEEVREVDKILRALASQLHADMRQIPLYGFFGKVFFLPGKDAIYTSSKKLITLANWMYSKNEKRYEWRAKLRQEISDELGIFLHEDSRISAK